MNTSSNKTWERYEVWGIIQNGFFLLIIIISKTFLFREKSLLVFLVSFDYRLRLFLFQFTFSQKQYPICIWTHVSYLVAAVLCPWSQLPHHMMSFKRVFNFSNKVVSFEQRKKKQVKRMWNWTSINGCHSLFFYCKPQIYWIPLPSLHQIEIYCIQSNFLLCRMSIIIR